MSKWIPPAPKIPLKTDTKMVNLLGTLMIVIPPLLVFNELPYLVDDPEKVDVLMTYAALSSIAGIGVRFRHFWLRKLRR
jgi:hypothetical protein